MYITRDDHFGYMLGTDQHVTRGRFLLLLQPNIYEIRPAARADWNGKQYPDWPVGPQRILDIGASCAPANTYAVVRRVALHQLGAFMMGSANLCGRWVTVSGSYGNDGLPMSVEKLPHDAVRVPTELYDAWNKGGGWNSAGSEATAMRRWAYETFK